MPQPCLPTPSDTCGGWQEAGGEALGRPQARRQAPLMALEWVAAAARRRWRAAGCCWNPGPPHRFYKSEAQPEAGQVPKTVPKHGERAEVGALAHGRREALHGGAQSERACQTSWGRPKKRSIQADWELTLAERSSQVWQGTGRFLSKVAAAKAGSAFRPPNTSWLRHGQAGPRIKPLQQRLRLLGHDVSLLHSVQRVARRQLQQGRESAMEGMA